MENVNASVENRILSLGIIVIMIFPMISVAFDLVAMNENREKFDYEIERPSTSNYENEESDYIDPFRSLIEYPSSAPTSDNEDDIGKLAEVRPNSDNYPSPTTKLSPKNSSFSNSREISTTPIQFSLSTDSEFPPRKIYGLIDPVVNVRLTGVSIQESSVQVGETFTMIYTLTNYESFAVTVYLGASIEIVNSEGTYLYIDGPDSSGPEDLSPGETDSFTRLFTVPRDIYEDHTYKNGPFDVYFGLWYGGEPGTSGAHYIQNDIDTVDITGPDLTPAALTVSDTWANKDTTITVTVKNNGDETASNFYVWFWADWRIDDQTQGSNKISLGSKFYWGSLSSGSSANIQLTTNDIPSGSHIIEAHIDVYYNKPNSDVSDWFENLLETEEDNNWIWDTYEFNTNSNPIADIDAPSSCIVNTAVSFFGDDSYDPDDHSITYYWSFGDGSHSSKANPSHTYSSIGSYSVSLQVTDSLGDSDITTHSITVNPPPKPDLWIESVSVSDTVAGDNIQVTAKVWNTGSSASEGFYVGFYIDETRVTRVWVSGLVAGYYDEISATISITYGNHDISAKADYSGLISEEDEDNNLSPINAIFFTSATVDFYVQFKYDDGEWLNSKPCRRAYVEIYLLGALTPLDTGYTDDDGYVNFFGLDQGVYVFTIYAKDQNGAVICYNGALIPELYHWLSDATDSLGLAEYIAVFEIAYDDFAVIWNIYDEVLKGYQWVFQREPDNPPVTVELKAPLGWPNEAAFGYSPSSHTIVVGTDMLDLAWYDDAIMHEYGHHIAEIYGFDDSPGGSHHWWDEYDYRLSWSEGWAHCFVGLVNGRDSLLFIYNSKEFYINFETGFTKYYGVEHELNNVSVHNEVTIACLLWDIIDTENDDQFSNSDSVGDFLTIDTPDPSQTFWDIITLRPGIVDAFAFWDAWFEYWGESNNYHEELWCAYKEHDIIMTDGIAPVINISISTPDGLNGWYVAPPTITIDVSDELSGIWKIEYRLDSNDEFAWNEYLPGMSFDTDGEHQLDFRVFDRAINYAEDHIFFKLDTSEPETSSTVEGWLGNNNWYRASPTVTLIASDIGSGDVTIYYKRGEYYSWMIYEDPFKVHNAGENNVSYYAVDSAGNIETPEKWILIYIDADSPVSWIQSDTPTQNGIYITDVQIIIGAYEDSDTSGVFEKWYRLGSSGSFTKYTGCITVDGSGSHTLYYYAVDNAGNVEDPPKVWTFTINYPPETPIMEPLAGTSGSEITLFWSDCENPEGGIVSYILQVSDSSDFAEVLDELYPSSSSYYLTNLATGMRYFRVQSLDDDGIHSEWSNTVSTEVVDINGPIITSDGPLSFDAGTPNHKLNWTISDESHPGTYVIKNIDTSEVVQLGSWDINSKVTFDVHLLNPGDYTFEITVYDTVGNPSTGYEEVYVIGNTATGSNIVILDSQTGIIITFESVLTPGITTIVPSSASETHVGFRVIRNQYYQITTTATYSGIITVAFPYDSDINENRLVLEHRIANGPWNVITSWIDTENYLIYGEVDSLSTFVILEDINPPATQIEIIGIEGLSGWYLSGVEIILTAIDSETELYSTVYSFDGIVWYNYLQPFTIQEQGEFIIYYNSTDVGGNVEDVKTLTVKVDMPYSDARKSVIISTRDGYITRMDYDANSGVFDTIWESYFVGDVCSNIALNDTDGDGVIEIYASIYSDGLKLTRLDYQDGSTYWEWKVPHDVTYGHFHKIFFEDLDSDGVKEIITQHNSRTSSDDCVYILNSDGTVVSSYNPGYRADQIFLSDYNGDGIRDLYYMSRASIYSAPQPRIIIVDLKGFAMTTLLFIQDNNGGGMTHFNVANIDSDASPEIFVAGWWTPVVAYDHDGTVMWKRSFSGGNADRWIFTCPALMEIGTGIVTTSSYSDSTLYAYYIDLHTGVPIHSIPLYGRGSFVWDVLDINGDGTLEAAVMDWNEATAAGWLHLYNLGTGTEIWRVEVNCLDSYSGRQLDNLHQFIDYDGDGVTDLLFIDRNEIMWKASYDGNHIQVANTPGDNTYYLTMFASEGTSFPSSTVTLNGIMGSNGWYVSDVEISVEAVDDYSGVDKIEYSTDGSNWQEYTIPVVVSTDGTTTFYFKAVDVAGNVEMTRTITFSIDQTPPVTTSELTGTLGENGWYVSDVSISLSASDTDSGEAYTEYSFDQLDWYVYSEPIILQNEGLTDVFYRSIDNAGNVESTKVVSISIDTIAPTIPNLSETSHDLNFWNRNNLVDIQWSTSCDDISGLLGYYLVYDFDLDTMPDESDIFVTEPFISGKVLNSGVWYVHIRACDLAGNWAEGVLHVGPIKIDRTTPSTQDLILGDTGLNSYYTSDVIVCIFASDYETGIDTIYYQIDSSGWTEYTSPIIVGIEGYHEISYYAVDEMGNEAIVKTINLSIDKSAPSSTHSIIGEETEYGLFVSSVIIELDGVDSLSGMNYIEYRINGGPWQRYSNSFTLVIDGTYTLDYYVVDLAGNVEAFNTFEFEIESSDSYLMLDHFTADPEGYDTSLWTLESYGSGYTTWDSGTVFGISAYGYGHRTLVSNDYYGPGVSATARIRLTDSSANPCWGFTDAEPGDIHGYYNYHFLDGSNGIWLQFNYPGWDDVTFYTMSNSILSSVSISVDVTQYHDYEILWENGRAFILIDGELKEEMNANVPTIPLEYKMTVTAWWNNPEGQWLYIDSFRLTDFLASEPSLNLDFNDDNTGIVQDIVIGDSDDDGAIEILCAIEPGYMSTGHVKIYDGATNTLERIIVLPAGSARKVTLGDPDHDGDTEIVVGASSWWETGPIAKIYVFNGRTATLEWESPIYNSFYNLWIEDLDFDGQKEIVAIADYERDGATIINGRVLVFDGITHALEWDSGDFGLVLGGYHWIGNLDSDNNLEILFSSRTSLYSPYDTTIWIVDGATHEIQNSVFIPECRVMSLTSADLDRDGILEIISGMQYHISGENYIQVFDRNLNELWNFNLGTDNIPREISVCNLDEDPQLEIISGIGYASGGWIGDFRIVDGLTQTIDYIRTSKNSCVSIYSGDVDDDGYLDLAIGYHSGWSTGSLEIYSTGIQIGRIEQWVVGDTLGNVHLMTLQGIEVPELSWTVQVTSGIVDLTLMADINLDGIDEVVVACTDGNLYCLNSETGAELWSFSSPWPDFKRWRGLELYDVDNDSYLEIIAAVCVVWHSPGGGVVIIENDGSLKCSHESPVIDGHNGNGPDRIKLGDFNGDSIKDVVCLYGSHLYPSSQPKIQILDFSSGTFVVIQDFTYTLTGSGMTCLQLADLNSDSALDFLTAGWWCPVVAFNNTGSVLWSHSASGGNADRRVVYISNMTGSGQDGVVIGTGAYHNTNGLYLYLVDPATGNNLFSPIPLGFTSTSFHPWTFGNIDDDPAIEIIAGSNIQNSINDRLIVVDGATGTIQWIRNIEYSSSRFMLYDVDSDGSDEIFIPNGESITLFDGDGSVIWNRAFGATPFVQSLGMTYESITIPLAPSIPSDPPAPPTLYSPGVDAEDGDFSLSWLESLEGSKPVDYYEIMMGNTISFNVIRAEWSTVATNLQISGIRKGSFYLRVRAVDIIGVRSDWSNIVEINVLVDILPPLIVVPADITYECGTVANEIIWIIIDPEPSHYNIFVDGSLQISSVWDGSPIVYPIDGLSIGTYGIALEVYDTDGNYASQTVFVQVEPSQAPLLDHPSDFKYEAGTIGHEISWNPSDLSPAYYYVYQGGIEILSGIWDGSSINVIIDGLDPGSYVYIVEVIDELGLGSTDEVIISVEDTTAPELPSISFTVEAGTTGNVGTVYATDLYPGTYNVYYDGTEVGFGSWNPIEFLMDGHNPGEYTYDLYCYDANGNLAYTTFVVSVVDTTPPSISSPDDLEFEASTSGNKIAWSIYDLYPGLYELKCDGTIVSSGAWPGDAFEYFVDGMNPGTYAYTLTLFDVYDNSASDEVLVVVLGNTPIGYNVGVTDIASGVYVEYEEILAPGTTIVLSTSTGPTPPEGFRLLGTYFEITTTATFTGHITIGFPYDETIVHGHEYNLKIWQWREIGGWEDVTLWVDVDNNVIYAEVSSFSSFGVMEDNAPPSTSISISGEFDESGWYVSEIAISFSASDSISDIIATYYSIDGSSYEVYTNPIQYLVQGQHIINYYSVDAALNIESVNEATFMIDSIAPETNRLVSGSLGENGWYVSDIIIVLSASDTDSGVSYIEYKLNELHWQEYTNVITVTEDGAHSIIYRSVDEANNIETAGIWDFYIDTVAPSSWHETIGAEEGIEFFISPVGIILIADDIDSGVWYIEYHVDSNPWQIYEGPFVVKEPATHVVEYRAVDIAGHIEASNFFGFDISKLESPIPPEFLIFEYAYSDAEAMQRMLNGEVDLSSGSEILFYGNNLDQGWYNTETSLRIGYGFFTINCDKYPFNITSFRRAFAFAFDKERVCSEIFDGTSIPLDSPIPILSSFSIEGQLDYSYYSSNYEIAEALLDAAGFIDIDADGYRNAPDGTSFEVRIEVADVSSITMEIGYLAEEALQAIGINAICIPTNFNDYMARMNENGDFDIVFLGVNFNSNQILWLAEEFSSISADQTNINRPNFRNATFDYYAEMLYNSVTYSDAYSAGFEMQRILIYECPVIPCYENYIYTGAKEGLLNVSVNNLVGGTNFDTYNNMLTEYEYLKTVKSSIFCLGLTNPFHLLNWDLESEFNPLALIYEGLARTDLEGALVPSLADSWIIYTDGTSVDIHINLASNVVFHDLHPFSINDIIFTFEYMRTHANPYFYSVLEEVTGYEILSDSVLVIHANHLSYWDIKKLLVMPILPEHLWSTISEPCLYENNNPIGTGPFLYLSHTTGIHPESGNTDLAAHQLVTGAKPEVGTIWTNGISEFVIGINFYSGQVPLDYSITVNYDNSEIILYGTITQDDIIYEYDIPTNVDDVERKHYITLPTNTYVTLTVDWTTTADLDIFIWLQNPESHESVLELELERWHDYYRSPHQLKSLLANLEISPKWYDIVNFDLNVDIDGPYDLLENVLYYRYSSDNESWSDWVNCEEWYDIPANIHETINFDALLGEGYYWFRMNTTDWVGHHLSQDFVIGVDYQDPVPEAGEDLIVQQFHSMLFDGSTSFDSVGIKEYIWTFTDGVPITLYGKNPEYIWQNEGIFTVTLTVTDYFGHTSSDTLTVEVIYDEDPPIITVTGPPNGSVVWTTELYIIESVDKSYIDRTEIYVDGTLVLSAYSAIVEWEFNPYTIDDGSHIFIIVVYDIFGHLNEIYIEITSDTTAPTIDSPEDYSYEGGTLNHYITWNPNDPHPGWYEILRNSTIIEYDVWTGESITISIDGLNLGKYNYTIIVQDLFLQTVTDEVWVTVEGNTPIGEDVEVEDSDTGITLTFDNSTTAGWTNVTTSNTGPHPPDGFKLLGVYYNITTTVQFEGMIVVAIPYDESLVKGLEKNLKIWHWSEIGGWEDVTVFVNEDNNIIYGEVTSLSPFAIMEDDAPPITSINVYGMVGTNDWYTSDVVIELTAWDSISEIQSIAYSFDYVTWYEYAEQFTISNEGCTTLYYNSTDVAWNVETSLILEIYIDKTAPSTDLIIGVPYDSDGNYITSLTPLTLISVDEVSGKFQTYYRIDGDLWILYSNQFSISAYDGIHHLEWYSVDLSGNIEGVISINFNLDNSAPSSSHLSTGTIGWNEWFKTSVAIYLKADDGLGSDVGEIYYILDSSDITIYTELIEVDVNGYHTLEYWSVDELGNVESPHEIYNFKIDTESPLTNGEISPDSPTGLNGWYISDVTLILTFEDSTSGVHSTHYTVNDGTILLYEGSVVFSEDSNYVVEFWSVDNASNIEVYNVISFSIDKTSPETTLEIGIPSSGSDPVYVSIATSFILFAEDNLSGVYRIEYRIDSGSWSIYNEPFSIANIGNHAIFYRSNDIAGNVESERTLSVVVNAALLTYIGEVSGNYSDPVNLEAILVDTASGLPISGKNIEFTLGIQNLTAMTDTNGVATITLILNQPSGEVFISALFRTDGEYLEASDSTSFVIHKEKTVTNYTGSTVVPTSVNRIILRATVFDEDDGYWGDLTKVYVTFTIHSIPIDLASPILITDPCQVEVTDVEGVGVASIEISNLPEESYLILITLDSNVNEYYKGKPSDLATITIYEPNGDFVTGGGWIYDSYGNKGNFGFNVKYKKNGLPKGQAIYVFRAGDWEYIIKSNAWLGMAIDGNHSFFETKSTVQVYNSETNELIWDEGNYQMRIDVWDGEEVDLFQIRIYDKNGIVWHEAGFDPLGVLEGGNITIHSKEN